MFTALQPYILWIKLAAWAIGAAALFGSGWAVKGWKDDSAAAAIQLATQAFKDSFHDHETAVATQLQGKLDTLQANTTTIREVREKLVDRPVYRNVCLDPDGLRLIEAARTGKAAPSRPDAKVP